MSMHSVIFRIDFHKPNYLIIDSAGKIMSLLNDMGKDYWSEFLDAASNRAITASYTSDTVYRQLSVDPTSINFTFETSKANELMSLDSNENYSTLMKTVGMLCETFHVTDLRRAGLRLTCLKALGDNNDLKPYFAKIFDNDVIASVNHSLGVGNDFGIFIDGEDNDKIKYHLKFGPYGKEEAAKYFPKLNKPIADLKYNFISDIDLYEDNFALSIKPIKWAKALLIKSEKLLNTIEKPILEKVR